MMEDATRERLPVAARLRRYDYRLRKKNLLEKKVRTKTVQSAHGVLLLEVESNLRCFGDGFIR